jgi:thioesterase domain-containing protein
MPLSPFTAHLHEQFPLAKYMQVKVESWENSTLRITAPLAPNVNHSDTAFGGSISTLGILAGYTLIYIALKERQISNRIMIQNSNTDYRRPIDADLTAVATLPAGEVLEEFLEGLRRKRRARLSVEAQILSDKVPAAVHTGIYLAFIY